MPTPMKTQIFNLFVLLFFFLPFFLKAQEKTKMLKGEKYVLTFQDEFSDKKLNLNTWNYRTDSKHWSTQLPENVALADGLLHLKLTKDSAKGKAYTGAGIISKDTFGFGYYEAAMQTPKGAGWHSSFWLMFHDGSGGTGPTKTPIEIDIVENDSKVNLGYRTDLHLWRGRHKDFGGKYVPSENLNKSLQKVACLYRPDSVFYFFNGQEVDKRSLKDLPTGKLHIWLTCIASFLGGTEKVDDTALPSELIFDYVRYYKKD
jgi:beta-glucanase (GH16 family)